MTPHRWVLAAALILLLAGAGGVLAEHRTGPSTHGVVATTGPATPPPVSSTTQAPPVTQIATPPAPGATTAQIQAGLITPTDMGGYYRVDQAFGAAVAASAPCLAGLGVSPTQSGRAVQGLRGPDADSIPQVIEIVDGYSGDTATAVFPDVVRAVDACHNLTFDFAGATVTAVLQPAALAPVGSQDRAWAGQFSSGGRSFTVQVGVVRDGQLLVGLLFVDSVPPADPVMGGFADTLSAALGKLA